MMDIFSENDVKSCIERINRLDKNTQPKWGKMTVSQMLAHCNVAYDMIYSDKYPKPNPLKKFLLRTFLKPILVNDKPYKPGSPTSKDFKIVDQMDFELEKSKLIAHIQKTSNLGSDFFDGKESHSFGKLTAHEWNRMLGKHVEHHLNQFGV